MITTGSVRGKWVAPQLRAAARVAGLDDRAWPRRNSRRSGARDASATAPPGTAARPPSERGSSAPASRNSTIVPPSIKRARLGCSSCSRSTANTGTPCSSPSRTGCDGSMYCAGSAAIGRRTSAGRVGRVLDENSVAAGADRDRSRRLKLPADPGWVVAERRHAVDRRPREGGGRHVGKLAVGD